MDKCREEFEIFWTARCCGLGVECNLTTLINSDYFDIKAYYAWMGWKESRESMKAIKLPVLPITMPINYRIGFSNAVNRCEDAITSAGYKVE